MITKDWLLSKLSRLEPYIVPVIVILVGLGAFGLGRLSAAPQKQALRILYPDAQLATPIGASGSGLVDAAKSGDQPTATTGDFAVSPSEYVASKSGTKYYLTTCSSAGRIKDENRVYFGSQEEARAAGYEPAANCPGL
jgi:hypothetical protein